MIQVPRKHYLLKRRNIGMNLYLTNLSPTVTEADLYRLFGRFGRVESVSVVRDLQTSRPKGTAIVEMADAQEAEAAMASVHGKQLKAQQVGVSKSRPRPAA